MMKLIALALLISSQAQAAYVSLPKAAGGGSGTVTGVTATAPIQSTGGTAPVISCIGATGSVAGCLSAADWTTFNGKQAALTFTGTGNTVRATSPALVTPDLGTPSAAVLTNASGTAASLTAGHATALTTDPADCAANSYATAIDASGNLTCGTVSDTGLSTSYVKADGSRALSGAWSAGQPITATTLTASAAGASSTPGLSITGAPYTAGTATTAKAQLLVEPTGTTSTNWTTGGTMIGVNSASGFAGLLLDLQANNSRKFGFDGGSTSKLSVVSGSETVALTNDGTTICLDNTTHASSCYLRFRPNTGFVSFGVGTNTNSWAAAANFVGTDTAPATNLVPNGTGAAATFACHNSSATTGNYCAMIGTIPGSDKLSAGFLYFNDNVSAGSETGHIEAWTNNSATKSAKMKIAAGGQISYGGTAPTVGTCGTSPAVAGNDNTSRVTIGTGGSATACTLTFAATWANAPICQVRDETTGESLKGVPSTTALTFSRQAGGAFGASDSIAVNCGGYF